MHMNITSGLRRTSRPTAPIENSNDASSRYHVVLDQRDHASHRRRLAISDVRPSDG